MENLVLWGFYILTFYAFLPGLVSRTFGFRVFKRGQANKEIALTFDDGPDPVYTPMLLDLLKQYNAKATFFVVGIYAEKHPELLKRMHDEGHIIGIHNYVHKSNWFMRPGTVKKQIQRTSDIIFNATGVRTTYYRPPWGIVNLFDFSNLGYLQIILWSSLFSDWRRKVGAERLRQRMMKKLRPGEVLLLHDCGSTLGADIDAPANMLEALQSVLEEGNRRGYAFVTIPEMIAITDQNKAAAPAIGWFKRLLVSCWMTWERLFHVLFRVEAGVADSVFNIRVVPYHGKTLHLTDGQTINNKDPVIELHLDNHKLYQMMTESRSMMHVAIRLIREVEKGLPKLAEQIAGRPEFAKARGLYGITMINRGAEQFGFSVLDLPKGLFDKLTRIYLKLLLRVLHPAGNKRVKQQGKRLSPRIIAMSMDEFWRRYGGTTDTLKPMWQTSKAFEEQLQPSGTTLTHSTYENANAAGEFNS
ncbi:polysaccharide deacetylase family protein [Paenibacillus sp. GCM10027626]|uniref:polysaccharide deacetylase family protein n=1 Tax=Paenibacillus sp. GCM10027626 TaxID=3273411 RepID=UPI00362FE41F